MLGGGGACLAVSIALGKEILECLLQKGGTEAEVEITRPGNAQANCLMLPLGLNGSSNLSGGELTEFGHAQGNRAGIVAVADVVGDGDFDLWQVCRIAQRPQGLGSISPLECSAQFGLEIIAKNGHG